MKRLSEEQSYNLKLQKIVHTLGAVKPALMAQYKVRSLGLFGSYVRGEQEKRSDLDILVEFSQTPTLLQFLSLENRLHDLFGVKVDLVMKNALKPAIGKHILKEVVPV